MKALADCTQQNEVVGGGGGGFLNKRDQGEEWRWEIGEGETDGKRGAKLWNVKFVKKKAGLQRLLTIMACSV